jgi:GNAT superfamily N-acetyltransferase
MIKYRRANVEDLCELVRLRIEFMKEAMKAQDDKLDSTIKEALSEYFINTIKADSFIAWLALDDMRIVGTSGLCFYKLPPSYKNISGNVAYIMNMYTEPNYRGKGIASTLFEKTIMEAKRLGYKKICLHATEMGRPLYEKFGFKNSNDEMVLKLE